MNLEDFFEEKETPTYPVVRTPKGILLWLKATSGSGKSTIPHYMLENSNAYQVKDPQNPKKILYTVFPEFGFASVGPYEKGKTFGGCDSLQKADIEKALEMLENEPWDVYVEGLLTGSGTKGTGKPKSGRAYYDIMKEYPRKTSYLFIDIEWDIVLERIKARTGKTDADIEKLKTVRTKWEALEDHKKTYLDMNEVSVQTITNNSTKEAFISEFLERF